MVVVCLVIAGLFGLSGIASAVIVGVALFLQIDHFVRYEAGEKATPSASADGATEKPAPAADARRVIAVLDTIGEASAAGHGDATCRLVTDRLDRYMSGWGGSCEAMVEMFAEEGRPAFPPEDLSVGDVRVDERYPGKLVVRVPDERAALSRHGGKAYVLRWEGGHLRVDEQRNGW